MTWNKETAQRRIQDLKTKFPDTLSGSMISENHRSLDERDFSVYMSARERGEQSTLLTRLGHDQSRIVDGVHVYAKLLSYDDVLMEKGRETAQSHQRLLAFLNLHYATADRVIQNIDAIRVDYHGGRLHAVVLEPFNNERDRLLKAIQLCHLLEAVAKNAVEKYGDKDLGSGLRFGIDSGKCVAIGNASIKLEGRGRIESDPLFLGSAANEAAKLAENGTTEGIFLTPRASQVLGGFRHDPRLMEFRDELAISTRSGRIMEIWETESRNLDFERKSSTDFVFHQHTPPLSSIQFSKLHPSYSIRMDLCSIFADLDGYTAYVDRSVASGNVREAVRDIQVIRSELGLVLRKDFGGKKVRFIGDCIHGIIACGNHQTIDLTDTVHQALLCGGAMRSSFELCQQALPSTQNLGLAIGIECGPAPISRVGIRGTQSVRVTSAKVVSTSECEQKRCSATETAVGKRMYDNMSRHLQNCFGSARKVSNLDYGMLLSIGILATPAIASADNNDNDSNSDTPASPASEVPTSPPPFRPHSVK